MKMKRNILAILVCLCISTMFCPRFHVNAASKLTYKMVTEKVTYEDGDKVRGVVGYQYPVIKGESKAITKLNTAIQKAAADYFTGDSAQSLKESTLSSISEDRFWDDTEQYYYETFCKVTYNKNNVLGLSMSYRWYAGGVQNQGDYGLTFDTKTGKQLSITDLIEGNSKEVKKKIVSAAKKYFTSGEGKNYASWDEVSKTIEDMPLKNFKFSLSPKKVMIHFESYDLGSNFWTSFSVSGIYK